MIRRIGILAVAAWLVLPHNSVAEERPQAIVYIALRLANWEVVRLTGPGGKPQRLTSASERGGMNDETPLIPVFNPQPYGDLFAMRLSDRKVVRLTHNKWEDGTPTWTTWQAAKE